MTRKASWMNEAATDHEGLSRFLARILRSGVIGLTVTQRAAGANMSVDVATGDAWIPRADYGAWDWSTAVENLVIDAASVSDRIDSIVAWTDYSVSVPDTGNPDNPGAFKLSVVKGTPAGSPTAPSGATILAQIGSSATYKVLADVRVNSSDTQVVNARITNYSLPLALALQYFYSGNLNTVGHFLPNVADDTIALLNAAQTFAGGVKTFASGKLDTTAPVIRSWDGWQPLGYTPNTVTYNGNRSYDLVFNGVDLTSLVSKGMPVKSTRAVTAPTKCTSLNGSTQYYSKSSPAGMTFTDDLVAGAWVKLTSYAAGTIIGRYNGTSGWKLTVQADGRVFLQGFNAGSGNNSYVISYQSLPLNKWVHIAAQLDMSAFTATTTTSFIMFDGIDVSCSVARNGTNPTALIQAGNLEVGATNGGTEPFPGKIAEAFVFSAKVTQTTLRTYMSQSFAGTETNLISAYSFNNSINDLNTTNANNLTAIGGAVATSSDSPFAGGSQTDFTAGTVDMGMIMAKSFSTNTTLTVQVPEGYAIPTSGAVSAVSISVDDRPYGFPSQKSKWRIESIMLAALTSQSIGGTNQWISGLLNLTAPVGSWRLGYQGTARFDSSVSGARSTFVTLANSPTNADYTGRLVGRMYLPTGTSCINTFARDDLIEIAAQTVYTMYGSIDSTTGTETWALGGNQGAFVCYAENGYI